MMIGLTGTNGAGKTVAAEHLQDRGFEYYSLSDEIRTELRAKGLQLTRENLIEAGNCLRADHGPAVLADRIKARLRPDRNYVVDSIRNPHEVRSLQSTGGFYLLHLDAPREIRYKRVRKRGGPRTPASLDEFVAHEEREMTSPEPTHQQLRVCREMADEVLINVDTLDKLRSNLDTHVKAWLMSEHRPDWDTYFMGIAQMVALRSNCMKRKVAAVIIKDRRIISTGYNGTPRGVKNCNEGGCPRCNSLAPSGTKLEECLCSHAEENAIVQAAYHGIGLRDATIYSTFSPCLICTKMIINAGISEVAYDLDYPLNDTAEALLKEAAVNARRLNR